MPAATCQASCTSSKDNTPPKIKTPKSRPQRWIAATTRLRIAYDAMVAAAADFDSARDEIDGIRSEYEKWFNNMPEALQSGGTGDLLSMISELDFSTEAESACQRVGRDGHQRRGCSDAGRLRSRLAGHQAPRESNDNTAQLCKFPREKGRQSRAIIKAHARDR